MSVLVTGSSGRLGRAIMRLLSDKQVPCTGVDIVASDTTDVLADIRDRRDVFSILQDSDQIIHTAAVHGRHMDMHVPRVEFVETNILGTLNLLDAAIRHGVRSFVYTSTTSIYGKAMESDDAAVWVDENLPVVPRDIYDITKLTAENLCRDYFEKEGLNGCTLRVSRFMDEPQNDIANYRLYRGLDERDGAEAHWLALQMRFKTYELFNISNDTPFQKKDLKELKWNPKEVILRYFPLSGDIYDRNHWAFPGTIDRVYSIEKAKQILHYRPRYNFMELISGTAF